MALLNGLPNEYNALISALDAIDYQEKDLKWEFVKSRILQEEQRICMRTKTALEKTESAALVYKTSSQNNSCRTCAARTTRPTCNYWKKVGHIEAKCWKKNPQLNPHKKNVPTPALIAHKSDRDPVICLMVKYESSDELPKFRNWFIDSGCSNHMTSDKSMFFSYSPGHHSPVNPGNSKTVVAAGSGTINLSLLVNRQSVKCRLHKVLHVPDLGYQLLSVPTLDKSGFRISFYSQRCWIEKDNQLIGTGSRIGNPTD